MNSKQFSIIDSTLREGEQFINSNFSLKQKIHIAKMLSDFGVEFIELTNPAASQKSYDDCKFIANMSGLRCKVLTHIRCTIGDADLAISTGVHGIDVLFGTSSLHREFSHGKNMDFIIKEAKRIITYIKVQGRRLGREIIVRFSSEDSFRSNLDDLLNVYTAVSECDVNRIGIADTVGVATPFMVRDLITRVRKAIPIRVDIEFHGHNDTDSATPNSAEAVNSGATHIDTCIMGIGERVGITPLGGFLSRMYLNNPEYISKKYKLANIGQLDSYIAKICNLAELSIGGIPFNNPLTGSCAFIHKAGIHGKAVLNNPKTYESFDPQIFGRERSIIVSKITGWHTIKHKTKELNIKNKDGTELSNEVIKRATVKIKQLAEQSENTTNGTVSDEAIRAILINFSI